MPSFKNILGQRFGELTVLQRAERKRSGSYFWLCKCDCGNEKIIDGGSLRYGSTKSCGCLVHKFYRPNTKFKSPAHRELFSTYKAHKVDFCLSMEDFFDTITKSCYYCGSALGNVKKVGKANLRYTGIDRVDNSRGYIKNNIVPCCTKCNIMKSNHNQKEFLNHIGSIYNWGLFP